MLDTALGRDCVAESRAPNYKFVTYLYLMQSCYRNFRHAGTPHLATAYASENLIRRSIVSLPRSGKSFELAIVGSMLKAKT